MNEHDWQASYAFLEQWQIEKNKNNQFKTTEGVVIQIKK